MIYEQINDAYTSLANQWQDLIEAFQRLAGVETLDSISRNQLEDRPPAAPGLILTCDGHRGLADGASRMAPPPGGWTIETIIPIVISVFQDHRGYVQGVQGIESRFQNLVTGLAPGLADLIEVQDCFEELEQLEQYINRRIQEFQELTSTQMARANLSGLRDSVEDFASYPVLTSELGIAPPVSAPSAPSIGGTAPLQRTIEATLRDVLGHLPRTRDTRSFVLALNQTFQVESVEGHTQVVWTPRSFTGQTELGGGVTGAQASLYTRSLVALNNALPLLEGLYPLWPDPDPELVEAARAIVRSDLREVVDELGTEGGPRVARVDQLFDSLFDISFADPRPGQPNSYPRSGHLGYLLRVFGLTPDQVNTLEEELDVTNFTSLYDYAFAIRHSWNNFRQAWLGKDLGTRLVMLSRALAVAAETVEEINFAMDSVFVGPAERQVASFRDVDGNSVLVDELLSWVLTFASEEAPYLVREAGKRGAAAIIPTAQRLRDQVNRFIQQIPYDPDLPTGLRHPRVTPPLRELHTYLQRVTDLAQDINRPIAQI